MLPFIYLASKTGRLAHLLPFRNVAMVSGTVMNANMTSYKSGVFQDIQARNFGSYIEEYYTTNHAATGFSSPLRKTFVYMIFILQAVFTFGAVLHTNYYFTGRALPKPDGQTQLCSDSK